MTDEGAARQLVSTNAGINKQIIDHYELGLSSDHSGALIAWSILTDVFNKFSAEQRREVHAWQPKAGASNKNKAKMLGKMPGYWQRLTIGKACMARREKEGKIPLGTTNCLFDDIHNRIRLSKAGKAPEKLEFEALLASAVDL
jgi:hypothetical protein